ncbi:MAG: alcohol dehydrogenase catalytic domain-containing protein [Candidatus Latescibacter sp.]|nr:alcohol dehydrogenase catalytic domain-containing protein [Candidatus Latescibacter sp.]
MKAAVLTEYRKIEWKDVPEPKIGDSGVLVKVTWASICGSDQHVFNGEFHPRSKLPLIQGHEFIGTVAKKGSLVKGYTIGDRVAVDPIYWCGTCPACGRKHYPACTSLKLVGIDSDGGFAEYAAVKDFMLYPIHPDIPDRHAALIEPYSIGFHASKRASVQPGDTLAMFGAGKIGQSILQAARTITKGKIFAIDVIPKRLEILKSIYPDIITVNALETDPVEAIREHTCGCGVDIAFEATGEAREIEGRVHPVREAIRSIRGAGKVCVLSLGDKEVSLVMKELIWKEGILVTSRVSHGEFKDAIEHLARGDLYPEAMISAELPMSRTQEAYEMLEREPQNYLKVLLHAE